jgi:hypothetical protein
MHAFDNIIATLILAMSLLYIGYYLGLIVRSLSRSDSFSTMLARVALNDSRMAGKWQLFSFALTLLVNSVLYQGGMVKTAIMATTATLVYLILLNIGIAVSRNPKFQSAGL